MLFAPKPTQNDPELGAFICARKCPMTPRMTVGAISLAAGLITCTYTAFEAFLSSGPHPSIIVSIVGGLATFIGFQLVIANWSQQQWLHIHERGVARVTRKLTRYALRFDQFIAVEYLATRMYVNGIYTGTTARLRLTPDPETGLTQFKYSGKLKTKRTGLNSAQPNDPLDAAHRAVSSIIAQRMLSRLAQGEEIPWTNRLTLRRDALLIDGEPLPVDRFNELTLAQGRLRYKRPGKWFSKDLASGGAQNFVAGWIVLCSMASQPLEESVATENT